MSETLIRSSIETVTLVLPADLGGAAAPDLKTRLNALRDRPLSLDGAGVSKIGAQCLQVLMAAQADWRARNLDFALSALSPAFADQLSLLGVDRALIALEQFR